MGGGVADEDLIRDLEAQLPRKSDDSDVRCLERIARILLLTVILAVFFYCLSFAASFLFDKEIGDGSEMEGVELGDLDLPKTYEELVKSIQAGRKILGKVSPDFHNLARKESWLKKGGEILWEKFGEVTLKDTRGSEIPYDDFARKMG